ncbi:MgtC/SapB family protein [Mobilitalea sibirica]|uniref:MgtC/SapB family protein n=1 Tax=Mobilitalea sibirica TaxID=1462919 RepID=A0A8J7KZZ0_9FIRM|nr:MgtC/SapB family protein [Mobilitalea sibirica]MBH1941253.1 MgtC/SapB family protein [Mobilitalea sibirica]
MFEFSTDLKALNDTTIILRLALAVLLGGIIGFERGRTGRPAGLRTHILVCLGSAMAIMTNQYVYQEFGVGDPTRIAAQVISGIGFLGAGTIIVTGRHQVKGLTTAAGLWATACMGLAIGIGFYKAAVFGCGLIVFATVVLHRLDNYMLSKSKVLDVYVEFSDSTTITSVIDTIKETMAHIDAIEMVKPSYGEKATVAAIMTIRLKKKSIRLDAMARICEIAGVEFAEEI